MIYFRGTPSNALFQYWEGKGKQFTHLYGLQGEHIGMTDFIVCKNLPNASYQFYDDTSGFWTVNFAGGRHIYSGSSSEKFSIIPVFVL